MDNQEAKLYCLNHRFLYIKAMYYNSGTMKITKKQDYEAENKPKDQEYLITIP